MWKFSILIVFAVQAFAVDKNAYTAFLNQHNHYRAMRCGTPMTLNNSLNEHAQKWADELAERQAFEHDYSGTGEGENLASYWSTGGTRDDKTAAIEAVKSWYAEIEDYDFNTHKQKAGRENKMIGHFTQVVWHKSTQLGFGIGRYTKSNGAKAYVVVGRYYEPGNYKNMYEKNVFPEGTSCATVKEANAPLVLKPSTYDVNILDSSGNPYPPKFPDFSKMKTQEEIDAHYQQYLEDYEKYKKVMESKGYIFS